jgi:hypothetical protein
MQMLDIMRRLNSENAVRFLLSAYAESLQRHDHGRGLPGGVTTLPVAGVEDVRGRFEALLDAELGGGAALAGTHAQAIVHEAAEVFGIGLARMQALQTQTPAASAPARELVF